MVGNKVICIEDYALTVPDSVKNFFKYNLPQLNEIYTIREIYEVQGRTYIKLIEIINLKMPSGFELSFSLNNFKPYFENDED